MKRKISDSVDGDDDVSSRKRAAVTIISKPEQFREELFRQEVLDEFTKTYSESKPFKHAVIKDLVSPELLRSVRTEIQENLSFTPKETDIYRIYQSGDLANLDGLDDSSLKLLPSLLKLRNALYSSAFRDYLSTITESGPLSGSKTDMAINIYTPGCHLLCHDDVIGSRRVSYILYLTDPDEPWKSEWGGALRLYPTVTHTADDGKTAKVPSPDYDVSISPAFNQLSFFAVQPGESFHDVEEVYASLGGEEAKDEVRVRMAISGWYHIPTKGEEGFVDGLEEKLAEKSSLMQLQGKVDIFDLPKMNIQPPNLGLDSSFGTTDSTKSLVLQGDQLLSEDDLEFLVKYISPVYLTPYALDSVSDIFGEQYSLTLDTFLAPKFSESLREFIAIQESQPLAMKTSEIEKTTSWIVARPPHKHRFLFQQQRETRNLEATKQSPLQDLLENLFPSLPFYKWLQLATGQTLSSHNLLARRFRRGKDYTLATGYHEEDSRLEITLAITPSTGWEPDPGVEDRLDEDGNETKYEEADETTDKNSGKLAEGKAGERTEEKTGDILEDKTSDSLKEDTSGRLEDKTDQGVEDKIKADKQADEKTGGSPEEKLDNDEESEVEPDKHPDVGPEKVTIDESVEGKTGGSPEEKLDNDGKDEVELNKHADVGSEKNTIDGSVEEKTGEDVKGKIDKDSGEKTSDTEEKKVQSRQKKSDEEAKENVNSDIKNKAVENREVLSDESERQIHEGEKLEDGSKPPTVNDVGGYLMYMADDDVGDEGPDVEGQLSEMTGARASGFSSSKDNGQVKPDPAIYHTSSQGDGDEALFTMPATWNKLGIVLRDKGVMRFVKYVSQQAEGDRWDVCGEYCVVDQEDDEEDEVQNKASNVDENIYNTTEEEKEEEETETSDDY